MPCRVQPKLNSTPNPNPTLQAARRLHAAKAAEMAAQQKAQAQQQHPVMPCHALSCLVMPCHAMPWQAQQQHQAANLDGTPFQGKARLGFRVRFRVIDDTRLAMSTRDEA